MDEKNKKEDKKKEKKILDEKKEVKHFDNSEVIKNFEKNLKIQNQKLFTLIKQYLQNVCEVLKQFNIPTNDIYLNFSLLSFYPSIYYSGLIFAVT